MLGRVNLFWSGAGGFLTLFCTNEILAFHLSKTPKWLGGPLVYGGMIVGWILGISIVLFLGIEEPREPNASSTERAPVASKTEEHHDNQHNMEEKS